MSTTQTTTVGFQWMDYVVFISVLVISLGIGVFQAFVGDRQKTTGEYLAGNRKLGLIPVALSMLMSYTSSVVILGVPAEMYLYGSQMWLQDLGSVFAFILAAYIFVPIFYNLHIISANRVRNILLP